MGYIESWEEFSKAAVRLYSQNPWKVNLNSVYDKYTYIFNTYNYTYKLFASFFKHAHLGQVCGEIQAL